MTSQIVESAVSQGAASKPARLTPDQFAWSWRGWLGADWRVLTAAKINLRQRRRNAGCYEPQLLDLAKYLALKRQGPRGLDQVEKQFPLFWAAEQLNEDDLRTRPLKLMVLGNLPLAEVSRRSGIDEQVVDVWEKLFFDVRGQRESVDWLAINVIGKEFRKGNPEFARQMRLAIAAGPVGVAVLLDAETEAPLDEADRLLRRRAKIHAKLDWLADTPITSVSHAMQMTKLHAQIMFEERRLALAYKKLEARCTEGLRRHEAAMERLRNVDRRAAEKAAEAQRKHEAKAMRWAVRRKDSARRPDHAQKAQQAVDAAGLNEMPLAKLRWASRPTATPIAESTIESPGNRLCPAEAAVRRSRPKRARSLSQETAATCSAGKVPSGISERKRETVVI
jgi:hypothetical protein